MKMNRLFSFDTQVIQDLNAEIPRGQRSQFVNKAVKQKLYGESDLGMYDVRDRTGRQLLAAAFERDDLTKFMKRCIASELGIEFV